MSDNKILREKMNLFNSVIRMEKTDHVPNISNFFTWMFLDSDYPMEKILMDFDVLEKVLQEFHDRYQFDAYASFGNRNMYRTLQALGDVGYAIDLKTGAVNYEEVTIMQAEEYDDYIRDKNGMLWKMLNRKYPNLTKGNFVNAVAALLEEKQRHSEIQKRFKEKNGVPGIVSPINAQLIWMPVENFYSYYRGVKNLSLDLRKSKTKLKEALDMDFENEVYPAFKKSLEMPNESSVTDYYLPLLAHSFMSKKQFEEFYWPYIKRVIDDIVAAGKTVYIFSEASMMRLCEFFEDIPKGHVVLHPELDDVVELRKRLPNICLAGGMKASLLGTVTPNECADYAKYLLDTMGNGYIFSQDKMMSFRNDCKRENLLAVNEVVRNYRP